MRPKSIPVRWLLLLGLIAPVFLAKTAALLRRRTATVLTRGQ